jgi:hypothetical protein
LLALRVILLRYLTLGGPFWLPLPERFNPLAHLFFALGYFVSEGYVSTLLCVLIPLFLQMTDWQLQRKKCAYGGKRFPNYVTPADLQQAPANREALRLLGSNALFQMLKEELRLLFRLLRAAQLAYRKEFTYENGWQPLHKAAMVVLLRVAQISAALRHKGGHALAEECVRYQARVIWNELFHDAPVPKVYAKWLLPLEDLLPREKKRLTIHLWHEQAAGRPIAAPFAERYPAWERELTG